MLLLALASSPRPSLQSPWMAVLTPSRTRAIQGRSRAGLTLGTLLTPARPGWHSMLPASSGLREAIRQWCGPYRSAGAWGVRLSSTLSTHAVGARDVQYLHLPMAPDGHTHPRT